MIDIVFATRNHKKFLELRALLRVRGVRWRSLEEFPGAPAVRETGTTFRANAVKKALETAAATGCWAMADDSGIEIDALGGAPGVQSARFAGRHGNDEANNRKVLRLLSGTPAARRTARYRCVLALAAPGRVLAVTDGVWSGRIALEPSGTRGFGYDPLFYLPAKRKTAAQLSTASKHTLSHRARAARALCRRLPALIRARAIARPAAAREVARIRAGSPA